MHKAYMEIHDHAFSEDAGPNRFQALADYADIKYFESITKQPRRNRYSLYNQQEQRGQGSLEQLQFAALLETHRQRMNGLPGFETYNWEYQKVERLGEKLKMEIDRERKEGKNPEDPPTQLQQIKKFAAETLSLSAVNAPKKP